MSTQEDASLERELDMLMTKAGAAVPADRKAALGITDNLVRISVGIEDSDDLIADFAQALESI